MKLQNKVAIVSGGVRDIGKEISLKLAAEGARVAINYFGSVDRAEATLQAVRKLGAEAIVVQGDMTCPEDVTRLVSETQKAFGETIDILVNVAGGLVARKTLAEMDENFCNQVMRLNFNSTFLLTKACVPHMREGSAIVNLSSQAGRDGGGAGASIYAASKGAIMTFTRAMARELGPRSIRVNALCPGMIGTSFHDTFSKPEMRSSVAAATPLGREGSPVEVANAVAFLTSDESSFLTGVNVDINGGLLFS